MLSGCGGSREASTSRALKLRREDLIAVCSALKLAERQVAVEVASAKLAWRPIAAGLPAVEIHDSSTEPASMMNRVML